MFFRLNQTEWRRGQELKKLVLLECAVKASVCKGKV